MRMTIWVLSLLCSVGVSVAQVIELQSRILTKSKMDGTVTEVKVAPRFATTIRMPEAVNSVVVGDSALFQVEHSEKEPDLVFIKALTTMPAQTNLLISTVRGRQASLLVVSRGEPEALASVDFLLRYKPTESFLIGPTSYPSVVVGETIALSQAIPTATVQGSTSTSPSGSPLTLDPTSRTQGIGNFDELLSRQEAAALPELYGEHISIEDSPGDHVRVGVSEVIDAGQRVLVLFSVVNPRDQSILLMPPQVQLAGKAKSGFLIKRSQWSAAEQLPVMDYRLSKRRLGPRERADGVVAFERPPYKQSNETLLLQMAEAGAVDRPAMAPIGFGISTFVEDGNGTSK